MNLLKRVLWIVILRKIISNLLINLKQIAQTQTYFWKVNLMSFNKLKVNYLYLNDESHQVFIYNLNNV